MQAERRVQRSRSASLIPALGSLGILISGAVLVYLINPFTTRLIPPCPFLWTTGCYCPGCGATRALHSLLRGDVGAALGYNPLLIIALPALSYVYLSFLGGELFGRRLPSSAGLRAWTWVIPVVIVVYWIARNFPWEPFTYLAP